MYEYEISVRVLPDYDITATDVSEIELEVESGQLYPDYSGPYSVDAAMYDQTMATQYKNMTGNIVVNAVEEVNGVVTLPTADGEANYIDINDKSGPIITQYHAEEDYKVGITPIQSGTGDPSPTNIRPISGWTGAHIYVSPTLNQADATVYNIDWTDEAGTVYYANLDVTLGKLIVTHGKAELSDLSWSYVSNAGVYRATISDAKGGLPNCISDTYKVVYPNRNSLTSRGQLAPYNTTDKYICGLAEPTSGVLIYELATPLEYTLTPTEIQLLMGQNNIWADCGDITVTWGVQ